MLKPFLQATFIILVFLATLAGCSDPTPAPETQTPTSTPGPTAAPTPTETQVAMASPTETQVPAQSPTERPTAAPTATPAIPKVPAATDESPVSVIIPLVTDNFENVAPELLDSELACMAGTADTKRLIRIFAGQDEPTPEEWTVILGCLQEETLLRMFVGALLEDPEPLSTEASECIRTAFDGIDLLSVWLAGAQGNELDYTFLSGVFVTIACLDYEVWETAAKALDLNPGEREFTVCLMGEMGRTRGLTAALEAKDEAGNLTMLARATGCELEVEPEPPSVVPTATPGATPATTLTITVAPISEGISEYDRSDWKHWTDEDGDCQDARQEVLIAESLVPVTYKTDRECRVETGQWYGAFNGVYVDDPGDLDIDHLVPLKNAHLSGGWRWDAEMREAYANDLSDPDHLIAVTAGANRSKGAKGPEEWGPPDLEYWCQYATDWTEVKARWELTMTQYESDIVMDMLGTCEHPPDLEIWEALGTVVGEHKPGPTETPEGLVYGSCEDVEAAGEERVLGNQGGGEGFLKEMIPSARDGDRDGIVCER